MFVFPKQKQFSVGGVRFGGQVNNPCVLVGTIFYRKEKLFQGSAGSFDRGMAEELIRRQEALSAETGIPSLVDIYADSSQGMRERIDFVGEVSDKPFCIDSTDALVRVAGLAHAEEVGLVDRLIYNSINVGTTAEELDALAGSDVSAAILLAFNPLSNSLEGKMRVLEEGGGTLPMGLVAAAQECGVKKLLVDTGITPLGEGASSAVRALACVKARFGLPAGCGIHNAVLSWRWPAKEMKLFADAASNALARIAGADFLLYGPIERSREVFATVGFVECLLGEASEEFGLDVSRGHPSQVLLK